MKHSERRHLKDNELAIALGQLNDWREQNQKTLTMALAAVVLVAVAIIGFVAWRNRVDSQATAMLAAAITVDEARVVAPAPLPVAGNATPGAPVQPPNSYPTEKAKLEAALPKFKAAADAYPSSQAGLTARYRTASILVGLGRFDEAIAEYDRVIADASGILPQMARLGKAEAQLRASKHDAAIASLKELSERTDTSVPKEALLLELARAYKVAGKSEDARKTLNQIVEQHGESSFASDARAELEKIKG
jgi:predicted negative regulator of RcsB-dependent stress response